MATKKTSKAGSTTGPALPDLAYIVRPGDDNEELRYSLRSVAENVKNFGKIWIVGTIPSWVTGVETIELEPQDEKFANLHQSVTALVSHPDVAETVIIMNDDHFVIEKVDAKKIPVFHLGPTDEFVDHLLTNQLVGRKNTWLSAMQLTSEWVAERGGDPISYESHTPLPFNKAKLAELVAEYPTDQRCGYPQMYPLAGAGGVGVNAGNSKIATLDSSDFYTKLAQPMPYLSSNDTSFADGFIGGYVRGLFTDPSPFEE